MFESWKAQVLFEHWCWLLQSLLIAMTVGITCITLQHLSY